MAFALTSFFADGERFTGPGPYRGKETYVFTVTATTADVDFDLGDLDGNFWTEALADTTYGEMATQVLDRITNLVANYATLKSVEVPQLFPYIQAATQSGTAYKLTIDEDSNLPIFLFDTSNGLEAYTVIVEYLLKPNYLPTNLSYNIQV
jgi:hypothetical protein